MTNSLPRFIYSELNPNEYNFRIWANTLPNSVTNTKCYPIGTETRFSDMEKNVITFNFTNTS